MVVQEHRQATLVPHESDSSYVRTNQGLSNETPRTAPAQIAAPVVPAAPMQSSPLSPTLLYLIMFSGLLTALLIALYARRIGRGIPLKAIQMPDLTSMPPIPSRDAASWLPVAETTTEALSSLPTTPGRQLPAPPVRPLYPVYLPARPRQTDALPRRTILMPSDSNSRIPVSVHSGTERSGGLLSRYRDAHHP